MKRCKKHILQPHADNEFCPRCYLLDKNPEAVEGGGGVTI